MMSSPVFSCEPRAGQPYVADPVHLLRLHDAVEKVNSVAIKPRVTEGRREYRFDHFLLC
jgi:hypothetical protein